MLKNAVSARAHVWRTTPLYWLRPGLLQVPTLMCTLNVTYTVTPTSVPPPPFTPHVKPFHCLSRTNRSFIKKSHRGSMEIGIAPRAHQGGVEALRSAFAPFLSNRFFCASFHMGHSMSNRSRKVSTPLDFAQIWHTRYSLAYAWPKVMSLLWPPHRVQWGNIGMLSA